MTQTCNTGPFEEITWGCNTGPSVASNFCCDKTELGKLQTPMTQASGTFPVSQLFTSGDQNTGASPSASVLPMSIQGWFPLRLTSLISSSSLSLTRGSQEPSLATHSKAVLPVYTGTLVILSLRLLTRIKENQLCTLDQTFMRYLHLFWNILSKCSIYKIFFLLDLTKKQKRLYPSCKKSVKFPPLYHVC